MAFNKTQTTSTRFKIEDVDQGITLGYSSFKINQVVDKLVDSCKVKLAPNSNIQVGDELVVKDTSKTGNPKVFGGYIKNIDRETGMWKLECKEYVTELVGKRVKKVYENISPEQLLSKLIGNNTNFTFTANDSSGITIDKYVVDGPIIDAVEDIRDALNWIIRTDPQRNMVLEKRGTTKSGQKFTHGQNAIISNWKTDDSGLINTVELEGGQTEYQQQDTFSGDGSTKEFALTNKPVGNVKVTVGGTKQKGGIAEELQPGDDYYIDQDAPKIVFDTAPASGTDNIVVDYTYEVPIIVQAQASDAQVPPSKREISTKIKREWIQTFADARQYASKYVENHSQPTRSAEVRAEYAQSPKIGRLAQVVDDNKGVNEKFIVEEKTIEQDGRMELEIGTPKHNAIDWRHQVQRRLKELQQKKRTEETVNVYRSVTNEFDVSFDIQVTAYERSINDTFVIGHSDNGVLHSSSDFTVIDNFDSFA